jgi:hypothetical protein
VGPTGPTGGFGPTGPVGPTGPAGIPGRVVVSGQSTMATGFQQDLVLTCPSGTVPYGGGAILVAANNSTNVDAIMLSVATTGGWSFHAHEVANMSPLGYAWQIRGTLICAAG